MPLPRPDGIVGSGERRCKIQLVRCVADVTGVVVLGVKGGSIAYRMAEQNCTSRLMRECLLGALVL